MRSSQEDLHFHARRTVTRKNKIWLHIGPVSATLTFASSCFCSLNGYCPYITVCRGEPCPSAWIFVQNPVYLRMATGKKKLTYLASPTRLAIPGDICKINGLFTLLPHLPLKPIFYERNSLFCDISLPSSQSSGFLNKVIIPCLNTSSPDLLAHHVVSRVSLDTVTEWVCLLPLSIKLAVDIFIVLHLVDEVSCIFMFLGGVYFNHEFCQITFLC